MVYEYYADIKRVVDGDTVEVDVQLGFDVTMNHTLRLAHINAPERFTESGKAATAYARQWLADNPGPYLLLTAKNKEFEKYGRFLATVISPTTGRSLNKDIVTAGHSVAYE